MTHIRILILIILLWFTLFSAQAQSIFDRPWAVDYYNNPYLAGESIFGRSENAVGFDWGTDSPNDDIPNDNFSVRFAKSGYLPAGVYRFIISADEGFRLYIDQQVILDAWDDNVPGQTLGRDIRLSEGIHHIQIDYREFSGEAFIYLDWGAAPPDTEAETLIQPEHIVPESAIGTVTVTANALNVRSEPRIANNVLTRVQRGQQFPLLDRSTDGNWLQIAVDSATTGWVSAAYVDGSAASPISNNSDLSGVTLRSDTRLFVRVRPYADSEIIGLLRAGEVVPIVARNDNMTWWQIRDGNQIGWVSAQFITLSPDVNPARVAVVE
ncbi:MAG: SH3 domain-containing protein [Anaerolineae bacterium]|nr:SH3 domain-containing protein [Anaerolineae bacterium]MDQ7035808.1 SH3 domain-containing protein [Anaerolineae bacterium]